MRHFVISVSKRVMRGLGAACLIIAAAGCQPPEFTALVPTSGPPGTVVEVEGDLLLATVLWDAGTASERVLPSSVLSARFFTVPLDATPGPHQVQLSNNNGRSAMMTFTVTAGTIRPGPRVDDVTVSRFRIGGGRAFMTMMVHGANFDVGADIVIDGATFDSGFSRLLRNAAMNATDPSTLGYPIFHYATVWTVVNDVTPGSDLSIQVRNLDDTLSNSVTYRVAASIDQLDSDGDGLLDDWEESGFDADEDGTVDVDLPALGANPLRKDLFVEVDWMAEAAPDSEIWANVEDTFANAPILNPDGSQGIEIHIDRGAGTGGGGGDIIPFAELVRYDSATPLMGRTYADLNVVKANNFDSNRARIFRYCVFAWDNGHRPSSSGKADGIPARDFFVSLASWGADGGREDFQTGTFLHELGHGLNLFHGGNENVNSKDNYNSLMQYGNGWITDAMGLDNVYGPSQFAGIDTDCNINDIDGVFTYSQGQRRDLNEANLDERAGVCDGVDQDWDGDSVIEASVSANLDSIASLDVITDNADWANIMVPVP